MSQSESKDGATFPPCRHCHLRPASRHKRLCSPCYGNREVRVQYPKDPRFSKEGMWNDTRLAAPLPEFPTDAAPGTADKVAVMERRCARREQLFHPLDPHYERVVEFVLSLDREYKLSKGKGWKDDGNRG